MKLKLAIILIVAALIALVGCATTDNDDSDYDFNIVFDYIADEYCDIGCNCVIDEVGETLEMSETFVPDIGYAPMEHPLIGRWRFAGFISWGGGLVTGMNGEFYYVFLPGGQGFIESPGRENSPFSWSLISGLTLYMPGAWEDSRITFIVVDDQLIFVDHGPPCQEPWVFERVD